MKTVIELKFFFKKKEEKKEEKSKGHQASK